MKILTPLFTALIIVGTFIKVPIPPVPITLQTLFVFLIGLLLPTKAALASVFLYYFLGIIGLPVFSAGGGLAVFTGPTGGYMWGWTLAVLAASLIMKGDDRQNIVKNVLVTLLMEVLLYIPGLLWLGYSRHLSFAATISGGLTPFIVGDVIKIAVAAVAAKPLYPQVAKLLEKKEE